MAEYGYRVAFGELSGRIYAGKVNLDRGYFTQKDEQTGQAIMAVGRWLLAHSPDEPYEITAKDGTTLRFTIEEVAPDDRRDPAEEGGQEALSAQASGQEG